MDTPYENYLNISAKKLKDDCPSLLGLKSEVKRVLANISSSIKEAHKTKLRKIRYQMISNFNIPNMTNKDAQRYIFATIIEQLENNGFEVTFVYDTKNCYYDISWVSQQDIEEAKRQDAIISKAREKATR